MRLTLADVKNSSIPAVVGLASCNERFTTLVNEAQQRLVMGPNLWWELTQRYSICSTSGRITWPRGVANILSVAVDKVPFPIRNAWYEFLESGYGERDADCFYECQLLDRGTAVTFDDIDATGNDKGIKVYSTVSEDSGLKIGLLGYDENGSWIRTQVSGEWVDGEWLAIPTDSMTPTTSAYYWSNITDIIKPVTQGEIVLYELDSGDSTQRAIGRYEPDETRPRYRRSLVGGICTSDSSTVTVIVKKEFIPVRHGKDNDWMMIGNLPALKEMCVAIRKEEVDNLEAAAAHEAKARRILDDEASHYLGASTRIPVRLDGDAWAMSGVPYLQ